MSKAFKVKSEGRDILKTLNVVTGRMLDVNMASSHIARHPDTFNVNRVAKQLHPKSLRLRIKSIDVFSDDVKSYIFTSAEGRMLPYFKAGQYLTVELRVANSVLTRPYSLSSSPKVSLSGEYRITVKRVPTGFASGYILDNWQVGDLITAYPPEGTFGYEPLRDAKTVVGVAGGSGITPFISMAEDIAAGDSDFELILLYGARNTKEILFKKELDELAEKCDKFKVCYVLSDSTSKKYETGFIGADLIKKYAPADEPYSIFVCGPGPMYKFLQSELPKLGLENKYIRFEMSSGRRDLTKEPGFPMDMLDKTFKLTVFDRGVKFETECSSSDSILCALEKAGIEVQARCRSGECGFCRSKIVSGEYFIPQGVDKRRIADARFGYVHPCCAYPLSDIVIKIN